MRYWFIEWPARVVDRVGRGYVLLLAALSILCLLNVGLLLLWALIP